MKKRLNILCVLILLILGYSVFESLYMIGVAAKSGIESGKHTKMNAVQKVERIQHMKVIAVMSNDPVAFADSVYNEKTGEYVPAMYNRMIISMKTGTSTWQMMVMMVLAYLQLFVTVFAVTLFVRLIMSINRSNIFSWKNVRRLRKIGVSMILCFLCSAIPVWIASYQLSGVFAIKGYSSNLSELISTTNLVLGMVALIIGEVFAIGLKMKEEQELTI